MKTLKVIKENYGIKYAGNGFGARPDLTHPELVDHELSNGCFIIQEFDSFHDAFLAAHQAIATQKSQGDMRIIRITHHESYTRNPFSFMYECSENPNDDEFGVLETVTMTITGETLIKGEPHFTSTESLSRYHPVNGWVVPETIIVHE